jgi:hypothetical protein
VNKAKMSLNLFVRISKNPFVNRTKHWLNDFQIDMSNNLLRDTNLSDPINTPKSHCT